MNTNPNTYVTCLTDENDMRIPLFEEKLEKNLTKNIVNFFNFLKFKKI